MDKFQNRVINVNKSNYKIQYFTVGIGRIWEFFTQNLARRFFELNQKELIQINSNTVTSKSGHWVRTHLWDIADKTTDYIVYLDADIVPLKPLTFPFCDFGAVSDIWIKSFQRKRFNLKHYVNSGFFVASRETISLFNRWKNYPIIDKLFDQTPLNVLLQESNILTFLNPNLNYLYKGDFLPYPDSVINLHYASKKAKIKLIDYWENQYGQVFS